MLDGFARQRLDGTLQALARRSLAFGATADRLTLMGCACGLLAAIAVASDWLWTALALFALNRLLDGLDGSVARLTTPSDRGGLLDIVCDFAIYGAIPLGFALRDPAAAQAAAILLFAFYVNGASFLGFAIMAAKRGMADGARGPKSLYFTTGLVEGTETILFFVAMMLFPGQFPLLALVFATLCLLTTLARLVLAWRIFAVDRTDR
jgi:phosphatidylglycerophosphate synthase